ncbi:hypothetical protein CI15_00300 [Paraburkholderia monticola]|uniref:Uncharacterized protein n=1 Tax=Paraburkholderia monticola TaxID=1399968 RepID=A0A149Q1H3_9BURK|nr:hypothetical protein [Paraburkholderia monticola]KXU91074.1 hypothetical protein CI15_00300 [Paraburkholderia monticola]
MKEEHETSIEIVHGLRDFCIDLRTQMNSHTPGFEGDNIAVIIGRQAEHLAESFLHENAFQLLMHAAKMTLAARISIEQGMDEDEANAKLELVLSEVVKHLDE